MTTLLPSRRRVAVPAGRLGRQPWPTADVRWQPCATADVRWQPCATADATGPPTPWQPCATADAGRQQVATVDRTLHADVVRLAVLVHGLLHGTVTLRRPDLLGARLRLLCDDVAPVTGDDRLVDDLRTAAGLAVHALQSRPLALATPADFARLERLAELLTALSAACEPDATAPPAPARRREGWRARRRQARADRALFG